MPRRSQRLQSLSERPRSEILATVLIVLYGLTFLFGLIYLICIGSEDLDSNPPQDNMRSKNFSYMIVITVSTLVLIFMEFYNSFSNVISMIRLGTMIVLLVFVCLLIQPIIDTTDNAITPQDGANYTIGAMAITFGGAAALINILEVLRRSNISYSIQF